MADPNYVPAGASLEDLRRWGLPLTAEQAETLALDAEEATRAARSEWEWEAELEHEDALDREKERGALEELTEIQDDVARFEDWLRGRAGREALAVMRLLRRRLRKRAG